VLGDLGSGRLLPESLRQAPVQNHGVGWSGAGALNGFATGEIEQMQNG
jgi:hypothetical protein